IPTIIQDISPDDVMYLINAIYFNGSWQHGFKTSDTQNDNFYLQDGSTKSVPFMNQKIKANIYNGDLFSIIELPYGEGKSFSMYILEPTAHKKSIGEFASSIDVNSLTNAITMMDSSTVELKMPKWEYSYEVADMKPELSSMGMGIAFGKSADFSKIYDPSQTKVYISKAIHKTYIKVNEEGTEAAAATSIGISLTSVMVPKVFKIDHPFMYAIIEKQTGAILFLGMVNEP
ncbi:MAG: serpin family protein, partial [Ginsengibacter sp.]